MKNIYAVLFCCIFAFVIYDELCIKLFIGNLSKLAHIYDNISAAASISVGNLFIKPRRPLETGIYLAEFIGYRFCINVKVSVFIAVKVYFIAVLAPVPFLIYEIRSG